MIFGQLIEEVRIVVEGGGSRRRKAERQAAGAGEAAVRAAQKRHRVFPSPERDRGIAGRVKSGEKRAKAYSRKVLLSR